MAQKGKTSNAAGDKFFRYVARDASGLRIEGVKEAVFPNDVLSWLREKGLLPISIEEMLVAAKKVQKAPRRKRIKSADLATVFWQLATMLEGGIPITTALGTIGEETENLRLQQILQQVLENTQRGEPFSNSISKFPRVFNPLSCAIILAGEAGGTLPTALGRLASYMDSRDKLAKKVKSAITYPAFIFTFIILILIFIMTFIVPRFRVIFEELGGQLPAFTQAFMGFYDVLRYNLHYIIGCLVLLIISTVLISKTEKGHYFFSRINLRLPLLGKVFSQAFVVMFCRTMATLIDAGVSVLEALDILTSMAKNDIIRGAIERTKDNIVAGSNISLSMAAAGFFPNMVVKMTQVGEDSGSLAKVLDKTSSYYERKVDSTITAAISLLEPMMIVLVGAIVMIVVLALYLPIFSMSNIAN